MQYRSHFHKASKYVYSTSPGSPPKRRRGISVVLLFCLAMLALFMAAVTVFLKDLSSQIAVSDARDIVTVQINNAVMEIMNEQDYSADYFVSFEKSATGEVTAISSNMARINGLSAKILQRVVDATENRTIEVGIPAGNLTGISLLMGRGPNVPVQIVVLTSSRVEFNNNIVTAGINQTKHQVNLEVIVDIDILVPWGTESTQVITEVLIADTIVVGQVPETYLNVQ